MKNLFVLLFIILNLFFNYEIFPEEKAHSSENSEILNPSKEISFKDIKNFKDFTEYFFETWTNKRSFERNLYIGGGISWSHSHERTYGMGGDYYDPSNFIPTIYMGIGGKLTDIFYLGLDFTFDIHKYTYSNSTGNIYSAVDSNGNKSFFYHTPTTLDNIFAFRLIFGFNPKGSYFMPYIALGFSSGNASMDLGDVYNVNSYVSRGQIFGLQASIGLDVLIHKKVSTRLELGYNYFFFYDNQIDSSRFPYQKLQYIDLVTMKAGIAYKF